MWMWQVHGTPRSTTHTRRPAIAQRSSDQARFACSTTPPSRQRTAIARTPTKTRCLPPIALPTTPPPTHSSSTTTRSPCSTPSRAPPRFNSLCRTLIFEAKYLLSTMVHYTWLLFLSHCVNINFVLFSKKNYFYKKTKTVLCSTNAAACVEPVEMVAGDIITFRIQSTTPYSAQTGV